MALYTELIDPANLTGYARQSLDELEVNNTSLAAYLPNREVPDLNVRFVKGQNGFVPVAEFRAYDAEPSVGGRPTGQRVTLELPAIGRQIPVTEYEQLRNRNATDDAILNEILSTTKTVVRGISDRIEALRGSVLVTGNAVIDELGIHDDFGRDPSHTITLANNKRWDDLTISRLDDLQKFYDRLVASNGVAPGSIVMGLRTFRLLARGDEFKTNLIGGGSRPATKEQVNEIIESAGLPPITLYDRQTSLGRVIPDNVLLMLPAPVGTSDWQGTELGASFWGQTLTATDPNYGIAASEQPGLVVGTYKNERPPMIASVIADAIAMPVLANANLSLCATVASPSA